MGAPIPLPGGDIHLWRIRLDTTPAGVTALGQTLSAGERARASRLREDSARRQFIAGRGTLRAVLGRYLNCAPGNVEFCYGPQQKPFLAEQETGLQFNMSHSHGLALVAVTRRQKIGVDVEFIRLLPGAARMARQFFSAQEQLFLRPLLPEEWTAAFFKGWTRKEAYLKACGDGLTRPLAEIEVTLAPGQPARLLNAGPGAPPGDWSLRALVPAPGFAAALAVEGDIRRVRWMGE